MAETVFSVLEKKLNDEIDARQKAVGNGAAKDYPEYKELTGTIRGLRIGLAAVQDLARNYMEEDDD